LRAVVAAAAMISPLAGEPLSRSFVVSSTIAALVVAVTFVEMTRRSELLFLADLGHSFRDVSLFIVAECVVLEVLLRIAVG
jgi:hypothetical protein